MNRINPIHIGIFLLVVLLFMAFQLKSAKNELFEAKNQYASTAKLSSELSELKKVYSDKNKSKQELQNILRQSILSSSAIEQKLKSTGMTINSQSMDITALNYLMGKLYNGTFNISSLTIKKLSEEKATLYAEIKW